MPFANQARYLDGTVGERECGLVVKTDKGVVGVPLVTVSASVDIINTAVEVTLEQTFVNNSQDTVQVGSILVCSFATYYHKGFCQQKQFNQ